MSYEPEIKRLIECVKRLKKDLSPKTTLDQALLYLLISYREEIPLADLGEEMDWENLRVSREVNALASQRYSGGKYYPGYEVVYTEELEGNRIFKEALLTAKGKELKTDLIEILKGKKKAKQD